jgi:transcription initiation factor IIE alpha subunit
VWSEGNDETTNDERGDETMAANNSKKGFSLACPLCDETDTLTVKACDLTLECSSCGEPVSRADLAKGREKLEKQIAESLRLAAWLDLAATV